ncbi:MAG: response regulator [Breznakibacter sp.]
MDSFRIDKSTRKTTQYSVEKGNLNGNVVMSVLADNERTVWVGTYLSGFARLDPSTGGFERIPIGAGAEVERIMALAKGGDGTIWIGTYGGGVFAYNPSSRNVVNYNSTNTHFGDTISHNWINVLKFGNDTELWIGTFKGLDCLDTRTGKTTQFNVENGLLCDNLVYCVTHDRFGNTWVGTSNGLCMISADRKTSRFFYVRNGLSGNVINGIEEDANGNLWISTNSGLCRYSPQMDSFTNFYSFEGLQSNEFRRNAVCKASDGKLFFGGINGITAFYPQNIGVAREIPALYFTDFKIFNQSVAVGQKSGGTVVLPKAVIENPDVTIRHTDNVFSIEFIALEYTNPEKIGYKYKMDGFDDDWKTTNVTNRIVTYTNLNPGKYVFHVVASDNFNNQKQTSISIDILPPWWRTWWAFLFYLVIGAGAVFAILKEIHHRVEQTHLLMEAQHAEQVNEARLQLFSNISHEIKTPLTLIVNPLEKLRGKETDPERKDLYELMYRNAMRILRLMNQLMDVRKIDKGQLELGFQETDMVAFIGDVLESFEYAAKSKNINLQFQHPSEPVAAWIDRGNFDKVLFNLVANAFKFTPEGGDISVTLGKNGDKQMVVMVEDNGIGVDESMLEQIFERFFQVRSHNYKGGWGIGLHLSRKLVEMHYGYIEARQRDPQGIAFIVTLPLGCQHLLPRQIVHGLAEIHNQSGQFEEIELAVQKPENMKAKGKPKIVIAEDDDEIRSFLIGELKGNYQLFDAPNGKLAWGLVTTEMPDLVLSDVMMPDLNGLELCRKIKTHANTVNIPIILLTAKGKDEDMVEGLEYGAEHYIAKPFNIEVLKSVIARAIESRHALRKSYSRDVAMDFRGMKLDSADEKLMAKLMQALKDHIGDPSMSVETLSKEIGISRVHLHRKLKELANQSPRDFIKYMRLTQAAHLLTASGANVSEVAYAVGFSSHAYFTNCFRDQFGISPTDFTERAKSDPDHPLVKAALQSK